MRTTTRTAGFVAVIAVITALLSPAVSAQAIAIPQMTGTVTSGPAWQDSNLNSEIKVGVAYSSTIQGPSAGGWAPLTSDGLPDGLTATLDATNGVITVSGTPTAADSPISFTFSYAQDSEVTYTIEFTNVAVTPNTTATTTTVTTDEFSHYSSVNLQATVSSNTSGGTVDFYLDDTLVGNDIAVSGVGTASYTWAVPQSFVGSSPVVKAVYSGDATYAGSTSTSNPTVYIYGDRVISGYFVRNGVGTAGEHIRLRTDSNLPTSYTAVTGVAGKFEIALAAPSSLSDATATYVVEAVDSGYFHSSAIAGGLESPTTFVAATATDDADWTEFVNIFEYRDPTWTDQTLSQPRVGESYSDGVAADPLGSGSITYTATGDLPAWLTLSSTTGAITSTGPTDQLAHTFTLRATSDFGYIEKQFTLQAGDAGVAPSFEDTTIADLQVGTSLTDSIMAVGDPTITYSSTTLPAGLTLNATTGALTGTPTTAGEYVVTFTASNEFGEDTYIWEPTVKAAPDLELTLNFAAGTTIETASTEIGAGGLKVGSTYTLTMYSTPRILYTGTIDASGAFLHTITLPADTPAGAHELVLTGIAPDGSVLTARAWFTLLSNGRIGAISYAGPLSFSLAATGSEPLIPIGIASALLVAGFLALRRSRRKFAAE